MSRTGIVFALLLGFSLGTEVCDLGIDESSILQVEASRRRRRRKAVKQDPARSCKAPDDEHFDGLPRECRNSKCISGRRIPPEGFATFQQAWTQCGREAECGYIQRSTSRNGLNYYHLRRLDDPLRQRETNEKYPTLTMRFACDVLRCPLAEPRRNVVCDQDLDCPYHPYICPSSDHQSYKTLAKCRNYMWSIEAIPNDCTPYPPPDPVKPEPKFPFDVLKCSAGTAAPKTQCGDHFAMRVLSEEIRTAVTLHFTGLDDACSNTTCPKGDLAGCLVRLVGHDIMDFDPTNNRGGSDGCIAFNDTDNKGLRGCLEIAKTTTGRSHMSLELLWQDFCTKVSAADFFVIAAEALMVATSPLGERQKWDDAFKDSFSFGRQTATNCFWNEALPHPKHSCDAVEEVFMNRMGLTATQATALMGVHTLGRALPENSGMDGFWVMGNSGIEGRIFSPFYYQAMIGIGWKPAQVRSNSQNWQWVRADVGFPESPLGGEMMLNTDMCLAYQTRDEHNFNSARNAEIREKRAVFTRAEEKAENGKECCLWKERHILADNSIPCLCQGNSINEGCSLDNCCKLELGNPPQPCEGNHHDRIDNAKGWSHGNVTLAAVVKYANSASGTQDWRKDFMEAWTKATSNGHILCH